MGPDEPATEASATESDLGAPTTGVPAVDQVIADVDHLDEVPLDEHLEVFERAHESLRAALDDPAGDDPGASA